MSFFRNFATTLHDFERVTIKAAHDVEKTITKELPHSLINIEDLASQVVKGGKDELKVIKQSLPKPVKVAQQLENLVVGGLDKIEEATGIDTASQVKKLEGVMASSSFKPDGAVLSGMIDPAIAIAANAVEKIEKEIKPILKKARRARKPRKKVVKKIIRKEINSFEKLKTNVLKSKDVRKFIVNNKSFINKMNQKDKINFLNIAKSLL